MWTLGAKSLPGQSILGILTVFGLLVWILLQASHGFHRNLHLNAAAASSSVNTDEKESPKKTNAK